MDAREFLMACGGSVARLMTRTTGWVARGRSASPVIGASETASTNAAYSDVGPCGLLG